MLPGCREGGPGLRALAGGLRLAEAHPGAPQGPGAGGLARGSAARLLRGLWSRYRAVLPEEML